MPMPYERITPQRPVHPTSLAPTGEPLPLRMTSLEIAERTGKEHRHVLADIRKMLTNLDIHCADFSAQYTDKTGRSLPCFALPQRECLILASGYDVKLRARIIDRWTELERGREAFNPSDPQHVLALISHYAEESKKAQARINELEPKAEQLQRLTNSTSAHSFTETAATLDIRRKDLFVWLSVNDWAYRGPDGKWRAHADKIERGFLEQKLVSYGTDEAFTRVNVRVTVAGMAELDRVLDRDQFQKAKKRRKPKKDAQPADGPDAI